MVGYEAENLNENLAGPRTPHKESVGVVWVCMMCVLDGGGHNNNSKLNGAMTRSWTNENMINMNFDKYMWGSHLSCPLSTLLNLAHCSRDLNIPLLHSLCLLHMFSLFRMFFPPFFDDSFLLTKLWSHLLCAFFCSTFLRIAKNSAC